jgi:hypothetical protein
MQRYIPLLLAILIAGCTLDVISVPASRIKSAKLAEQPLLRGPTAPGAFKYIWGFNDPKGKLFDPSEVEFTSHGAGFKNPTATRQERVAVILTQTGPWFSALDSFKETLSSTQSEQQFTRYQLSPDSSTWYYHDGKQWVTAGPNHQQANSVNQINAHISTFHQKVGEGTLTVKAFLVQRQGAASSSISIQALEAQGVSAEHD